MNDPGRRRRAELPPRHRRGHRRPTAGRTGPADECAAGVGLQLPGRDRRSSRHRVFAGRRHGELAGARGLPSARWRAAPRSPSGPGWARPQRFSTWCRRARTWSCRPTPMPACGRCWPMAPPRPVEGDHGRHHRHGSHQAGGLGRRPAVAGVADQPADGRRRPAGAVPVRPRHRRVGGGGQHLRHSARATPIVLRRRSGAAQRDEVHRRAFRSVARDRR